jgi:hypothetical protein
MRKQSVEAIVRSLNAADVRFLIAGGLAVAADRGSVALVESVAGGVLEGRGRPASDVRFAARAARFKPVPTAASLRPRHDAGIRMSRFAEAPNDRTEVTMKQTQPNARKLTAVPVNGGETSSPALRANRAHGVKSDSLVLGLAPRNR